MQNTVLIIIAVAAVSIAFVALIAYLRSNRYRGAKGERKVKRKIGKTKSPKKFVFNDYRFAVEDKTVQIDHIVVNKNGVFVIETKNYAGDIYGDDEKTEWKQVLAGGKVVNYHRNPVKQNGSHIYHLKKFLPAGIKPVSLVVFIQNNTEHINSGSVKALKELKKALKASYGTDLSEKERIKIAEILKKHNDRSIKNSTHLKNIRKTQKMISKNVCPRCGAKLVLRHGEKGDFYGCSNYPKCKFVKENKN